MKKKRGQRDDGDGGREEKHKEISKKMEREKRERKKLCLPFFKF